MMVILFSLNNCGIWGANFMLFLPLLGDAAQAPNSDGRIAVITILASAFGGAVAWIANEIKTARRAKQEKDEKKEKTIVEHQQILIERIDSEKDCLEKDLDEKNRKLDAKSAEVVNCRAAYRVARSHIRYLERILGGKQISFERFDDPDGVDGTDEHRALPSPSPNTSPKEDF